MNGEGGMQYRGVTTESYLTTLSDADGTEYHWRETDTLHSAKELARAIKSPLHGIDVTKVNIYKITVTINKEYIMSIDVDHVLSGK